MTTRRFLLAMGLLLSARLTYADVVALEPVADATLFQPSAGNPETADSQGPHLFIGRIAQGTRRRVLLRFDLSALPAGATINSAQLELSVSRTISGVVDVNLHRVVGAWSEGSADAGTPGGQGTTPGNGDPTWSLRAFPATAWTNLGGDHDAAVSGSFALDGEGRYLVPASAGMLADLAGWQADAASNHGWMLLSNETQTPPTAKRLESAEAVDAATRPLLVIDYALAPSTPIPVDARWSLLALAFAIVLVGARARVRVRVRA